MRLEVVAASGKAPRARSSTAAMAGERECAGEGESEQSMTKMRNRRYLKARGTTVELRVASTTRIVLGKGEFTGGGELRAANGEGQREGLGFYRQAGQRRTRKGSRGAGRIRSPSIWARAACHLRLRHCQGRERKEALGKERKEAVLTGGTCGQ